MSNEVTTQNPGLPVSGLAAMREPFPAQYIGKLPKGTKAQNECPADQKVNCKVCGGWHHPRIVHLDYVGHAAITQRLLDADPCWSWEPLAFTEHGLPRLDESGGLWIRLTVAGMTRLGYGDAGGKHGPSATKEAIGDALRNAAMRFGAALELWHKGDWESDTFIPEQDDKPNSPPARPELQPYADDAIDANLPAWKTVVDSGKKTADGLIAFLRTKNTITPEQERRIRDGLLDVVDAEFTQSYEEAEQ
jgi:hypothetical protein